MSFQIEIRCDAGHDGCVHQGHSGRFHNVIAGVTFLATEAERDGWKFEDSKAICPRCKARRNASPSR